MLLSMFQLTKPESAKPPFRFGTVPRGSTETNIRKNDLNMYYYMKQYSRKNVTLGVQAVKKMYESTSSCALIICDNLCPLVNLIL